MNSTQLETFNKLVRTCNDDIREVTSHELTEKEGTTVFTIVTNYIVAPRCMSAVHHIGMIGERGKVTYFN